MFTSSALPQKAGLGFYQSPAINQRYHAFDTAMSDYLGQPLVANWCTCGQHASREAGEQIRNLQGGLQVVSLHDYGIVEVVPVPIGLLALVCGLFGLPRDAAYTEGEGLNLASLSLLLVALLYSPGIFIYWKARQHHGLRSLNRLEQGMTAALLGCAVLAFYKVMDGTIPLS